jgi:hypothetical protein
MRGYVRQIEALEAENRTLRFKVQSLEIENQRLASQVSVPSCRSQVIDALQSGLKTTREICSAVKATKSAVRCAIYDLHQLGVLTRTGPHPYAHGRGGIEYHYFLKEEKR